MNMCSTSLHLPLHHPHTQNVNSSYCRCSACAHAHYMHMHRLCTMSKSPRCTECVANHTCARTVGLQLGPHHPSTGGFRHPVPVSARGLHAGGALGGKVGRLRGDLQAQRAPRALNLCVSARACLRVCEHTWAWGSTPPL